MRRNDFELMTFVESYRRSTRDRGFNLETNLSDLVYDSSSDSDSEYECLFSEEIHKRRASWKLKERSLPSIPSYILPYSEQLKLTRTMNTSVPSFVSHVEGMDDTDGAQELSVLAQARLLSGEKEVQSADNVCLYSSQCFGLTSGQTGRLFVTTLKVSFQLYVPGGGGLFNKLLSDADIPLASIESVWELHGENSDKKRRLALGSVLPSNKISGIVIRCKNFKIFKFKYNLQSMKVDGGRNITNAILHHARPSTPELLFGYENSLAESVTARTGWSWDQVISDSGVSDVRVTRANEVWQVSPSLPRQFVIPGHVTDALLTRVADTCTGNRPPVWIWGHRGGSLYIQPEFGIVPSPKLDSLIQDYFKSDSMKVIDPRDHLPKLSALEESYTAMLDLHCVDTEKEMKERDDHYFSSLESAGWLSALGACLRLAEHTAEDVVKGKTVVMKDEDGRTLSILVSSLVMVMMSGEFRTRKGLERLILSNWVNLGFKFSKHHVLTAPSSSSSVTDAKSSKVSLCPLFLLFLDCVHQLCSQFPAHFEFRTTYLIAVWDAALLPVTQTFIFDCEHDREVARQTNKSSNSSQVPTFDWSLQFTPEQVEAWNNPLFGIPLRPPRVSRASATDISPFSMVTDKPPRAPVLPENSKVLPASGDVINMAVWSEMFSRDVPSLQRDVSWEIKMLEERRQARRNINDASRGNGLVQRRNNHK